MRHGTDVVQYQFVAERGYLDRALADGPLNVAPAADERGTAEFTEFYIDTPDWRLFRAGAVFRVRHDGEHSRLTLEPLAGGTGTWNSKSATVQGALEIDSPRPLALPPSELGILLRNVFGDRAVRAVLPHRGEVRACTLATKAHGAIPCDVSVSAPGQNGSELISIELGRAARTSRVKGELQAAEVSIRGWSEAASSGDVFRTLARDAGVELPEPPARGKRLPDGSDSLADGFRQLAAVHLARIEWNEPGVRLGFNPECLHVMRVSARRIRVALSLFDDETRNSAQEFANNLKLLEKSLGEVRDLDVYLARISKDASRVAEPFRTGLAPYEQYLREQRDESRQRLIHYFDSAAFSELRALCTGLCESVQMRANTEKFCAAVRRRASKRLKTVLHLGRDITDTSAPSELHNLRKQIKRFRYTIEFLHEDEFPKTAKMLKRVREVADALGVYQDASVGMASIVRNGAQLAARQNGAWVMFIGLGQLVALDTARQEKSRAKFANLWKRIDDSGRLARVKDELR